MTDSDVISKREVLAALQALLDDHAPKDCEGTPDYYTGIERCIETVRGISSPRYGQGGHLAGFSGVQSVCIGGTEIWNSGKSEDAK